MTRKEARINALRLAGALLYAGIEDLTELEREEYDKICDSIYAKALKLGGPYKRYTGMPLDYEHKP